jgi:tRNA(fMet)-specific endonuclease VapC
VIRYFIDTDIASYFLRQTHPPLNAHMKAAMREGEIALSAITRAELRYGQSLMETQDRRQNLINLFLMEVPTLEWTSAAADHYGQLAAIQKKTGKPIGVMDTQIAAHALAEELTLITHNTRHYKRIPGLKIEDWTR